MLTLAGFFFFPQLIWGLLALLFVLLRLLVVFCLEIVTRQPTLTRIILFTATLALASSAFTATSALASTALSALALAALTGFKLEPAILGLDLFKLLHSLC